jgi:two-component system response regulator NreC
MTKIKILLADDHPIVRTGLRLLLNSEANVEIVGEAEDGQEVLEKVAQLSPDIILMDSTIPILNALEVTRQIGKRFPQVKVLVLAMYTNGNHIFQFLQVGVSGYLAKQASPTELLSGIQAIHRGNRFLSPTILETVIEEFVQQAKTLNLEDPYEQLTDREREVLQLIVEGFPNREIAKRLYISMTTVRVHRNNLIRKLNIDNVPELTMYAVRKGIISLKP